MTRNDEMLATKTSGKKVTKFNALKHGVLSGCTVLPWEDDEEYLLILSALVSEQCPLGPTEVHLVEEIAGIFWRKRRLRLAENSAHQISLEKTTQPFSSTVQEALAHIDTKPHVEGVVDVVRSTPKETAEEIRDIAEEKELVNAALAILHSKKPRAYKRALAVIHADTLAWWEDTLQIEPDAAVDDEERATATVEDLKWFLEDILLPSCAEKRQELENRTLVRRHAFGQSFDPEKLSQLSRYELHLDRRLERTLTMLYRLKDIRARQMPT